MIKADIFSEGRRRVESFQQSGAGYCRESYAVFRDQDEKLAQKVEPLEAVVDELNQEVKKRHIHRLREENVRLNLDLFFRILRPVSSEWQIIVPILRCA